ncbi:hypothetical protein PMAYCL1PPCAC_31355, partial [Pristionchus mayeri]
MLKTRQISVGAALVNAVLIYAIGIICFIVPEKIGPYERGFYCGDASIRAETRENTVLAKDLFLATVSLSFIAIFLCESYLYLGSTADNMVHYRWFKYNVPSFIVYTAKFYGFYHFGFVLQIIFNQFSKYFVGRLRPHFIDVCRPTPGYECTSPDQYVTNFTCVAPSETFIGIMSTEGVPCSFSCHAHYIMEARMSFFSGHAASSFYFAVFISLYLRARLATRGINPRWLRKLQISLVIIGAAVSYTRIADNFHHPSDIIFGAFYGVLMGFVTIKYIMGLFIYKDGHIAVENPEGMRVFANFVMPIEGK